RAGVVAGRPGGMVEPARRLRHVRPAHRQPALRVLDLLRPGHLVGVRPAAPDARRAASLPDPRLSGGSGGLRPGVRLPGRQHPPHREARGGGDGPGPVPGWAPAVLLVQVPRAVDERPRVLITGASSGIGRACARLLVERGWRVFAAARTPPEAPPDGPIEFLTVAVRRSSPGPAPLDDIPRRAARL